MKLKFDVEGRNQPDPFIFEDKGKYYLYTTGWNGVDLYTADDPFDIWHYEGLAASWEGCTNYWAPSVIKYQGKYYIYVSCECGPHINQFMHVGCADSPMGPFESKKMLYDFFSIDSHMTETEDGLYLWHCQNRLDRDRPGTRVFVEKYLDPWTPSGDVKEVILPTLEEEKKYPYRIDQRNWHIIEGPFWFQEGDWQYVMYSGSAFARDTYHIGYVAARTDEPDQTRIDYIKHTKDGSFDPVLIKNDFEEGNGHHSVLKYKGEYYAIYHARDYKPATASEHYEEARTARICRLHVKDGIITATAYPDKC